MALLIKATTIIIPETEFEGVPIPEHDEGKKLKIPGTDIQLESIYARIKGEIDYDGVTMLLAFRFYQDKPAYNRNKNEHLQMPEFHDSLIRIIPNPMELIYTAHDIAKEFFEGYGYEVEIVDLPSIQ